MGQYIFVVGTGRTGTYFLKQFFEYYFPAVLALHEPDRGIKFCTNLYLSHKIGRTRLRSFLAKYRTVIDKKLSLYSKKFLVQCDPWFFGFLEVVQDIFGDAHIIHIVRNPRTYIPSQLNMYYDNAVSGFLRDVIPYWKLRGDKTGDYSRKDWMALSREEKTAWYWHVCNSFIEAKQSELSHYLRIRYEDLFEPSLTEVKKILEFAHIPYNDSQIDVRHLQAKTNTQKKKFPAFTQWSAEKQNEVEEICKKLVMRYNYV